MKNDFIIFILSALICFGCSSPKKLYEKGKYFKSFDSVYKEINNGKKDRKDVVLLNKSFSKMIDQSRENMRILQDGYKIKDLQHNFKQYEEVDKRFVKARSYIKEENKVKYDDFVLDKIALITDTYNKGLALMEYFKESNNKLDAKNAFYHFELVKEFSNEYDDIDQLLTDSKSAAVVVYVVDADLDYDYSYQWDVDREFDNLRGESDFFKIIYANSSNQADCFVELEFSRLGIDERQKESSQTYTKEIQDGHTSQTDTSGVVTQVPNYIEVSGTVTTKTITKIIEWRMDIEVRKSSVNCDLREERFRASIEDQVEQYVLSGDERAIPQEFKSNRIDRLRSTDDMVEDLIRDLYLRTRNYFY